MMRIGCDIVQIQRIRPSLAHKILSENEQRIYQTLKEKRAIEFLAGHFAAKEAVSKALGTGFSKISPSEIKILRDEKGKPVCILCGNAKEIADNLGIKKIFVSISHCREYASATAVAED